MHLAQTMGASPALEQFATLGLVVIGVCILLAGILGPVLKQLLVQRLSRPSEFQRSCERLVYRLNEAIDASLLDHLQQSYRILKSDHETTKYITSALGSLLERQGNMAKTIGNQADKLDEIAKGVTIIIERNNRGGRSASQ